MEGTGERIPSHDGSDEVRILDHFLIKRHCHGIAPVVLK